MTLDDILDLARGVGAFTEFGEVIFLYEDDLKRMVDLVLANEREACAQIADERFGAAGRHIGSAIRARSKQ